MNNKNLVVVTREYSRTARNDQHTQEGYLDGNVLKFCAFAQNIGIDVY